MSHDFDRKATKRASRLATDAADQFDSTILHNRVSEQVDGQHNREHVLLRTLDLAERAYRLADEAEGIPSDAAFDAAETLDATIEALVDEQIALACAHVIEHADEWTDSWDADELTAAKAEALDWLNAHEAAVERTDAWADIRPSDRMEVPADA